MIGSRTSRSSLRQSSRIEPRDFAYARARGPAGAGMLRRARAALCLALPLRKADRSCQAGNAARIHSGNCARGIGISLPQAPAGTANRYGFSRPRQTSGAGSFRQTHRHCAECYEPVGSVTRRRRTRDSAINLRASANNFSPCAVTSGDIFHGSGRQ